MMEENADPIICFKDDLMVFESGQVTRYHASPQMNRLCQTNADHQWGVVVLALAICPEDCDRNFMIRALLHDAGEIFCGDDPSPFKKGFPELAQAKKECEGVMAEGITGLLPEISLRQIELMKVADISEAILCILKYSPRPTEVAGFEQSISTISERVGRYDSLGGNSYKWIDENINPLLEEAYRQSGRRPRTVTPF